MIEKVKQSTSEKLLIILFIILGIIAIYIFFILPQKCLFIKDNNPDKLIFSNPENIAILNVNCGNIIIELYPEISPKSVKRFKMLISSISATLQWATEKAIASCSIIGLNASRCFVVNFLESFNNGWVKSCGKITAAAVTGPAKQPLPASSVPASTS